MDKVADPSTRFELTTFFEGHTTAWGIFEDRFGQLRRRFRVQMHGHWQERHFHLDERFVYDTGESEVRTWIVTPHGSSSFTATCPDCVGFATGECSSDSISMRYRFRLRFSGREMVVAFDDRIYRMENEIAFNRAVMSKWGLKLGALSLFFRREEPGDDHSNMPPQERAS